MNKSTWIIILIIIVLLIIALVAGQRAEAPAEPLVTDENAVLVLDQKPEPETIVTYAKLSKPGFVVVLGAQPGATAPTLMGVSDLLEAGEHRDVTVAHNNEVILPAGAAVAIAVLADDGDEVYKQGVDTEFLFQPNVEASGLVGFATITEAAADLPDPSDENLIDLLVEAGYNLAENGNLDDNEAATGETVTVDGTVTAVNTEQAMLDGPVLVTIDLGDGVEMATIAVPSMGLPLCGAYPNIADVYTLEVGAEVEVKGIADEEGRIVPCEDADHYLRLVSPEPAAE